MRLRAFGRAGWWIEGGGGGGGEKRGGGGGVGGSRRRLRWRKRGTEAVAEARYEAAEVESKVNWK